MAEATQPLAAAQREFFSYSGPTAGVNYPFKVQYCGECSMPIEYCEFYPNYEKCKKWLESHLPGEFERLVSCKGDGEAGGEGDDGEKKKRQTRGGKGTVKAKKKSEPQGIKLGTAKRGKKKMVTIVMGLASYDIDLKEASKYFANKFACGSNIQAEDEIVIQGDVKDDLFDILPEKWKSINEDDIDDIGEVKK
ncbi:density-regulated protein homolog isoform X2 [Ruditapes philippinarum]|uniref:density-regulated protein homolog isoform X1 n=1 Tax=Ruditapes philippinarum TaxID=129788 RepID=UPI00295BE3B2|nr:density-regulated protein homolog isoform X1 [Ruditapes philippinarum]XP_060561647.1 density-regulated protein homolog isoform X2 [Ruditapes philippinarum]